MAVSAHNNEQECADTKKKESSIGRWHAGWKTERKKEKEEEKEMTTRFRGLEAGRHRDALYMIHQETWIDNLLKRAAVHMTNTGDADVPMSAKLRQVDDADRRGCQGTTTKGMGTARGVQESRQHRRPYCSIGMHGLALDTCLSCLDRRRQRQQRARR